MSEFFDLGDFLDDRSKRFVRSKEGGSGWAGLLQSREENDEEQDEEENEALDDSTEFLWFSFAFLLKLLSCKQRPHIYDSHQHKYLNSISKN